MEYILGRKDGANSYYVKIDCDKARNVWKWGIDWMTGSRGGGFNSTLCKKTYTTSSDAIVDACIHALHELYLSKIVFFNKPNMLVQIDKLIAEVNNFLRAQSRPQYVQLELFD